MIKYLLFDLDGTLTDSKEGILNAVVYALSKFGIEEKDRTRLMTFIGPPFYDNVIEQYGLSPDDAEIAVKYFREYYAQNGMYENTVYEGITDMLDALKKDGKTLILATSKPEAFACRILEHFSLDRYFDKVFGATLDGSRRKKTDVIAYALMDLGIAANDAVMIGDRKYDVEGGHNCGLLSVGVLYGYGDREEMVAAEADMIAADVDELKKILEKI